MHELQRSCLLRQLVPLAVTKSVEMHQAPRTFIAVVAVLVVAAISIIVKIIARPVDSQSSGLSQERPTSTNVPAPSVDGMSPVSLDIARVRESEVTIDSLQKELLELKATIERLGAAIQIEESEKRELFDQLVELKRLNHLLQSELSFRFAKSVASRQSFTELEDPAGEFKRIELQEAFIRFVQACPVDLSDAEVRNLAVDAARYDRTRSEVDTEMDRTFNDAALDKVQKEARDHACMQRLWAARDAFKERLRLVLGEERAAEWH